VTSALQSIAEQGLGILIFIYTFMMNLLCNGLIHSSVGF